MTTNQEAESSSLSGPSKELEKAVMLLSIIVRLAKREHYNNEWHLILDNDSMYLFDQGCKELKIRKTKGPAVTPKTTREEKLRRKAEKRKSGRI